MSPRVGARRRFNVFSGLAVLVCGLLGGALTLFESAAQAQIQVCPETGIQFCFPSSTSTSTTSTTVPESESTTSTSTTPTTVHAESTIVTTTTTEPETTTTVREQGGTIPTTTTDPVPASLPRTGSGAAVAAMFGILCIAAGVLLVAGRRKPWSRS